MAKARIPELKDKYSKLDYIIDYLQHLKTIEQTRGVECRVEFTERSNLVDLPTEGMIKHKGDAGGLHVTVDIVLPNYKTIDEIMDEITNEF